MDRSDAICPYQPYRYRGLGKIGDKRALDQLFKLAKILKGIEIETIASEDIGEIVKVAIDRIKARDHRRTENSKRNKSKK